MKKSLLASFFAFALLTVSAGSAHAATLYWYNSGADAQWTTRVGNWWTNIGHSSQAGALPGGSDNVVTLGTVGPNVDMDVWTKPSSIDASSTGITFTNNGAGSRGISINILGSTTFNGYTANEGTITGTTIFNYPSYNQGTVIGTAIYGYATGGIITFSDTGGWTNGTATSIVGIDHTPITQWIFNGTSQNDGNITGSTTFNDTSFNNTGIINGTTTFNGSSYNAGIITGTTTFNGSSVNNSGGTITGLTIFNDSSYNSGTITGTAVFTNATGGTITIPNGGRWGNGTATNIVGADLGHINHWIFSEHTENDAPIVGDVVFNGPASLSFTDVTVNDSTITGSTTFNGFSLNANVVIGTTTMNGISTNFGGITGPASFHDSSSNFLSYMGYIVHGTVNGDATFFGDLSENSSSTIPVFGTVTGTKTRYYTSNISPTRDFTSDGPWTVVADGAVVDLTNATYDTNSDASTTVFEIKNHGSFLPSSIHPIDLGNDGPPSPPITSTKYFWSNGSDANWTTVGNWYVDAGTTTPLGSVPTGSDDVITLGNHFPSVNLDSWTQPASIDASRTGIAFTSTAGDGLDINITGSTTFNGSSNIENSGSITGTTTINGTSNNQGTI